MVEDPDQVLAALANPTRRLVVELLGTGPLRSGELAVRVGLPPTAITRHLRTLRDAGVVEVHTIEGDARGRLYRLRVEAVSGLLVWAGERLADHAAGAVDSVTGAFRSARRLHSDPGWVLVAALASLDASPALSEALRNPVDQQMSTADLTLRTSGMEYGSTVRQQIAQLIAAAVAEGQLAAQAQTEVVVGDIYAIWCGVYVAWALARSTERSEPLRRHVERVLAPYRAESATEQAPDVVRTANDSDERAFIAAAEPLRGELRMHCYRMTGDLDESEDLLQETFLRAWRAWPQFRGESSVRTWLYRIATNVCLSALERRGRRLSEIPDAGQSTAWPYPEPIPDRMLAVWVEARQPDDRLVERETIELAFVAALLVLSPRQRAAFVLRDVLGLPAGEVAEALDVSIAATKSALQRARANLREALKEDRMRWPAARATSGDEWTIARRYVTAIEQRDGQKMAELLHTDLRVRYLPRGLEVNGNAAFIEGSERYAPVGDFRYIQTTANGQPAIGVYLRPPGTNEVGRVSLAVLRVAGERIVEIIDFSDPITLDKFGLPACFPT